MDDQEQLVAKVENDPLSDSLDAAYRPSLQDCERGLDGPEEERTLEGDVVKRLSENSRLERIQVYGDVR